MSNEEDRDVRSMAERTADERFPEMVLAPENEQRAEDFSEGYVAGYAAGFHRTPAPTSDVQTMIHEARILGEREWQAHWPGCAQRALSRLADALEALVKERDQAIRDLDDAEKHARMRASESADFERERDELAAVIEDALAFCREQHDSIRGQFDQTGGAPAEYIGFANACGDVVGILSAAPANALREHDAALIESLAEDEVPAAVEARRWLRERARQVREGEA